MDCLFCKIVAGTIPAKKLFEDESVLAFADISPKAPVHILIIPKKHYASLNEFGNGNVGADEELLLGHLYSVAARLAGTQGLTGGYRTVNNTGPDGGQTVDHLHVHLMGGREMQWPPG
ncbi:MAG TPA: histidine triad nucleotide-binding protein [Acidisarcina sp.]